MELGGVGGAAAASEERATLAAAAHFHQAFFKGQRRRGTERRRPYNGFHRPRYGHDFKWRTLDTVAKRPIFAQVISDSFLVLFQVAAEMFKILP